MAALSLRGAAGKDVPRLAVLFINLIFKINI